MAKTNLKMLSLAFTVAIAVLTAAEAQGGPVMPPSLSPSPSTFSEGPMSPGSAGAPLPALDCTDSLVNMSACLTYVEQGSNATVPDKGCCPGLAGLINNQPACLCQLLATGDALGVKIDTTKALMLPTACNVSAPPVSLCSVLGIPVTSPVSNSPSPSSGGPEEPGLTPNAAPPNTNTASTSAGATLLAALITVFVAVAFF